MIEGEMNQGDERKRMKTYTKDQVKDLKVLAKTYKSVISNFEKAEVLINELTYNADFGTITCGQLKKAQNRLANLVVCEDFLEGLYIAEALALLDGIVE